MPDNASIPALISAFNFHDWSSFFEAPRSSLTSRPFFVFVALSYIPGYEIHTWEKDRQLEIW